MKNSRILGVVFGLLGIAAWAYSIMLYTPPFMDKFNFFINAVQGLDSRDYIVPLAFLAYTYFSFRGLRNASLAASLIALVMCGVEFYESSWYISKGLVLILSATVLSFGFALFRRR